MLGAGMTDDALKKFVADKDLQRQKIMEMSSRALSALRKFDTTDEDSMYLANICVEMDAKYDFGSHLTLDWLVDHYIAMEFERRVEPKLIEIYEALKAGGHNSRDRFEHFDDRIAY